MSSLPLSIIVLAAGKGTRMKSEKAKVLHEVFFSPMIHHVLRALVPLNPTQIIAVVGHQQVAVKQVLNTFNLDFAIQEQQLGTGHAVLVAEDIVKENIDTVMVLCGDTPLVKTDTLVAMYEAHRWKESAVTLMTTRLTDPTNYGRVLSAGDGKVTGIVEQKDASREQLLIKEINAGTYCVDRRFLFSALKKVGTDNSQKEVYLTDIVKLAVDEGLPVAKFATEDALEVLGVNSRVELAEAHRVLQLRRNSELMLQGVSMQQPASITVSPGASIGKDTLLEPGISITGTCRIGESCLIGQGTILKNCKIGDRVSIGAYSVLTDTIVDAGSTLAAFSRNC